MAFSEDNDNNNILVTSDDEYICGTVLSISTYGSTDYKELCKEIGVLEFIDLLEPSTSKYKKVFDFLNKDKHAYDNNRGYLSDIENIYMNDNIFKEAYDILDNYKTYNFKHIKYILKELNEVIYDQDLIREYNKFHKAIWNTMDGQKMKKGMTIYYIDGKKNIKEAIITDTQFTTVVAKTTDTNKTITFNLIKNISSTLPNNGLYYKKENIEKLVAVDTKVKEQTIKKLEKKLAKLKSK